MAMRIAKHRQRCINTGATFAFQRARLLFLFSLMAFITGIPAVGHAVTDEDVCPSNLLPATTRAGLRQGILQLTNENRNLTLADPFIERSSDGVVRIFGTSGASGEYLEYRNEAALFSGQAPTRRKLEFFHPDGQTPLNSDEIPWGVVALDWNLGGKATRVLYGGAMSPPEGQLHARFPENNRSRRTFAFSHAGGERWIRRADPVLADTPADGWVGYSAGRDFVREENGEAFRDASGATFILYERVTRLTPKPALVAEILMRRMPQPFRSESKEIRLLGIDEQNPFPAVVRANGSLMMEGPRITRMVFGTRSVFVMGFSAGDFPTDRYGMHLAWSDRVQGPYRPLMTADGRDLRDLGEEFRRIYNLSWGPSRPAFYRDLNGRRWVLFHAVDKRRHPGVDFSNWPPNPELFQRNLYLAPFEIELDTRSHEPRARLTHLLCRIGGG